MHTLGKWSLICNIPEIRIHENKIVDKTCEKKVLAQDVDNEKYLWTKVMNLSFLKHKQLLTIVFNKNPKVKLLPTMLTLNVNRVCWQKLFTKNVTKIVVKSIFEQTFLKSLYTSC